MNALFFTFAVLVIFAVGGRSLIDPIIEALNNFRGGGPPTRPMHPSPVNDRELLRKRLLRPRRK
jgi:hypothetical protein